MSTRVPVAQRAVQARDRADIYRMAVSLFDQAQADHRKADALLIAYDMLLNAHAGHVPGQHRREALRHWIDGQRRTLNARRLKD